jgi:hypothetical protein
VINKGLDPFHESNGVWQLCVMVERGFIFPAGMDVEEPLILGRAEGVDRETAGFLPGWCQDFADDRGDFLCSPCLAWKRAKMKSSEITALSSRSRRIATILPEIKGS